METSTPGPTKKKIPLFWAALAGLLVLCLCACALAGLARFPIGWQPFSGSLRSMPVQFCAGFTTSPTFQVGIAWASPVSSYLPPIMLSPYSLCAHIPFTGALFTIRLAGQIAFPP